MYVSKNISRAHAQVLTQLRHCMLEWNRYLPFHFYAGFFIWNLFIIYGFSFILISLWQFFKECSVHHQFLEHFVATVAFFFFFQLVFFNVWSKVSLVLEKRFQFLPKKSYYLLQKRDLNFWKKISFLFYKGECNSFLLLKAYKERAIRFLK